MSMTAEMADIQAHGLTFTVQDRGNKGAYLCLTFPDSRQLADWVSHKSSATPSRRLRKIAEAIEKMAGEVEDL